MNVLIVVDMQVDFVNGALGTKEAEGIVDNVVKRIEKAQAAGERIIFTRDTHQVNYMETQEGRKLPVPHCIEGTEGWQIVPELRGFADEETIINKPTFGSTDLGVMLDVMNSEEGVDSVTLIGLCTDICVISNAMIAKATLPEVPIKVESACCAGVSPATHLQALEAMKMCHIEVE